MTVPPNPNLDCFDTVGSLTHLLLGVGLTGPEREEVIAKTRALFNEAYQDVIEELLDQELANRKRAKAVGGEKVRANTSGTVTATSTQSTVTYIQDPPPFSRMFNAAASGIEAVPVGDTDADVVPESDHGAVADEYDGSAPGAGASAEAGGRSARLSATAEGDSHLATSAPVPLPVDDLTPTGSIQTTPSPDSGDVEHVGNVTTAIPDTPAATPHAAIRPDEVGAVSPTPLGDSQGDTASTTWTEFFHRAEKSLGKQRAEYVDANLLIASEIMLGRHELPPLAHDPSRDGMLRRKLLTDIRAAIAHQLHMDRNEPDTMGGSIELSETLREFYNTRAVDPFVVPGGSPLSWLKGKKKKLTVQDFSPSAVSNWHVSSPGSSQAGPSTGITTSPTQSYIANPYFTSIPEDRARFATTWRLYPRYLAIARHLMSRNPQLRTIPEEDLSSLIGYTGNSFFDDVNSALRNQDYENLRRYDAHIRTTVSALNRMPIYVGPVTRTIELYAASDLKKTAAKYRPGSVVRESSFVSTDATSQQVRPGNIHFTIHSTAGRRIDSISEYQGTEVEVLFLPGTSFRVTSNKRRNGEYFIEMTEVPVGAPSQSLSYSGTSANPYARGGGSSHPAHFSATATHPTYSDARSDLAYPGWHFGEGRGEDAVAGLPAEPLRTLQVGETGFAGIEVHWDPEVDLTFLSTVREQLGRLASKPVGRALLDSFADAGTGVDASAGSARSTLRLAIQRVGAGTVIDADAPAYAAHAGNRTEVSDAGGVVVRYNPNAWETADGMRPPFIGLAHELIHAHRVLHGLADGNQAGEEAQVVGFREYDGLRFTENAIRAEHGWALRRTYSGAVPDGRDDSYLGAAPTSGKDPRRAGEGARVAPTGEASGTEHVPAGTSVAGQNTQRRPVDPPSAFLDAPRPAAASPSTEQPIAVTAKEPGEAVSKPNPVSGTLKQTRVQATPPKAQGQSAVGDPASSRTQPVPTPAVQGTAAGNGLAVEQPDEVTPAQASPPADALKELVRVMLKTDLDAAGEQLEKAQEELAAAEVRQANGTASSPCDLAVAQALHSLAEQQFVAAKRGFQAVGG